MGLRSAVIVIVIGEGGDGEEVMTAAKIRPRFFKKCTTIF
jgi:hypothetical protein